MGKTSSRSDQLSHADRKFEKKLQFYSKVRETVASLSVQKTISKNKRAISRKKKLKAYDLSSLAELLPDLNAENKPTVREGKLNSKSRQNLVVKEASKMRIVLEHPAFQSDPLGSIQLHLESTQPPEEQPLRKKKVNQNGSKKRSKNKKSSGPQSMET